MQLGFLGLGKMGSRMVEKLLGDGHEVVVWNRSSAPLQELQFKTSSFAKASADKQNLKVANTIQDLLLQLKKPRVIWLMLPAGEVTESALGEVVKHIEAGDIVIDGGNAYFKDTQKRYEELRTKNVKYLGIGVSGGVHGFANGFALMVGGDKSAYELIAPILDSLAKPNGGYDYFGDGGAGHFVKMIHNGIE
ncbi:MAG: NAD(P)-binding domain-containing protein, partial [Candidatus Levybacteria bacterium]|nr:NAD(P)-binding domain-containing protein [Candidatus Levybacteria bacterium]